MGGGSPAVPERRAEMQRHDRHGLGEAHFRASRIRFGASRRVRRRDSPGRRAEEIGELQTFGGRGRAPRAAVASAFAWLIAGRALAPVRLLTETARSISQSDLTRRIEVRGTGEAAEMARSFNAMLDRLETVFRSQREFIEDASHELRDPLTICPRPPRAARRRPRGARADGRARPRRARPDGTDRRRSPAPRRGRAAGLPRLGWIDSRPSPRS